MSQNIRPTPADSLPMGISWNVAGSGRAIMSASETGANPPRVYATKPIPSAKAPSSSAGATATDFRYPSTSVNQSRTKRISRSSRVRSTNSSCLSTAIVCPVHVSITLRNARLAPAGSLPAGAGQARPSCRSGRADYSQAVVRQVLGDQAVAPEGDGAGRDADPAAADIGPVAEDVRGGEDQRAAGLAQGQEIGR